MSTRCLVRRLPHQLSTYSGWNPFLATQEINLAKLFEAAGVPGRDPTHVETHLSGPSVRRTAAGRADFDGFVDVMRNGTDYDTRAASR